MEGRRPALDVTRPDRRRVLDRLLRGKDAFRADRDLADALEQACPAVAGLAAAGRRYALAAAGWAPAAGIRQVVQLAPAYPRRPAVHDAAGPGARVAYVTSCPVLLAHIRALHCGPPGVTAAEADWPDPDAVLAAVTRPGPDGKPGIDLTRPVLVLACGILSHLEPGRAGDVVAGLAAGLARGSAVAVTAACYSDPAVSARMAALYAPCGPWADRGPHAPAGWLEQAGLGPAAGELTVPGTRPGWRPGWGDAGAAVFAAAGIKG